jgi:hypothetical protein
MPKKKIAEIVRGHNGKPPDGKAPALPVQPVRQTSGKRQVRVMPPATPAKPHANGSDMVPIGVPLVAGFENKVGRYELVRVDGDQAYYSFTNRQGRTVDAIMSATMWRRMQARADTTYQETA